MPQVTIHTVLKEFREAANSNRDLGDRFERLMVSYFRTDPLYVDKFSNVWLWMEWPGRGTKPDTGIDLVAEDRATGGFCAIQCKFYDPRHTLDKADIDSFFTASGRNPFTSRMIISTTDKWSVNAEAALEHQTIPVTRLRVQDLDESPVDWSLFSLKTPERLGLRPKKTLRPHQAEAVTNAMAGFQESDRGKLIMACGTGKTFTALKVAEQFATQQKANVLFLVPSISLLSQTLREWTAEAELPLHSIAVCSDTKVGKQKKDSDTEDISVHDLAFPATTKADVVAARVRAFAGQRDLTVIFSTYQSIQAISDAQAKGLPEFDLIICDEAHRTTGATFQGQEESYFVRVHDQDFIKGKKRLYMTATPRLYGDVARSKALEDSIVICSMDDEALYGPEFYRLGFGKAVGSGLLTDYRVMVLAVDEKYVSSTFQRQLADKDNELSLEDAVKITGCWNGLSKRMMTNADGEQVEGNRAPMRRAVAFARSIKDSKRITQLFSQIVEEYERSHPDENVLRCELDHVDGTQNSLMRHAKLDWLKADTSDQGNVCRILSNARCLSEGVDVPTLDAVIFLTPRNSVVDVVQSVGRVMRKAPGKEYGYIILPIGVPADTSPEEALRDNERYKVVWQVLQALRAHDDRFNATINKLELTSTRPLQIDVIGVGGGAGDDDGSSDGGGSDPAPTTVTQLNINFPQLEEWRDAIYARIVQKCGDRRYWEQWAGDVARIADSHISRIKGILDGGNPAHRQAFDEFLAGLHQNLNPNVTEEDAIEMLSQHLITKPVFDALFEGYAFAEQNPVSLTMQKMLDVLEGESLEKETAKLDSFYASVRERASGIDNAEGKQRIVVELYDKFFRNAFPRMTERLGIVYTPVEVVDFIVRSADHALRQEFGVGLTDEGVHVLDPFTGTGTFMVRLLQSGLIRPEDLERKFKGELHANEIVLLAYYIAAINIEETYHGLQGGEYQPFNGIVLTDTFQMFEGDGTLIETMFPENNERVTHQKQQEIQVIVGNPPYSSGQISENDGNQNIKYPQLDERIGETYAQYSSATNKNSLYNSYIRAIRWASDRIKDKGVVCYVSNGAFVDNNAMDGLRKCWADEFSRIYCFNLRGNQRTSGETSRREGGKIFGSGSRSSIAITLLVKNPEHSGDCELFYHDIGDYLSREEKLQIIRDFKEVDGISWQKIIPNESHDWINQRDPAFDKFILLGDKQVSTLKTIFDLYSGGIKTNRDPWCYNFSSDALSSNMSRMIDFYNEQLERYQAVSGVKPDVDKFIDTDAKKISWSVGLKNDLKRGKKHQFDSDSIVLGVYRPYCKQWTYFNKEFNDRRYQIPRLFPDSLAGNLVICVTGTGSGKEFSVLMVDSIPNLHLQGASTGCQNFPICNYTKQSDFGELFEATEQDKYIYNDNIPDSIEEEFRTIYGDETITKNDIFYYVYGVLHSPEYRSRFAADLKKMLPRVPYAADFWVFSSAGEDLASWHIQYETVERYKVEEYQAPLMLSDDDYRVQKMTFGKHHRQVDKTTIIYNRKIKLAGIPLKAYEYKVCDRSALDWIMERYQVTKDKASGIVNDPNTWSDDPRYIVDLVKRIVRVSVETVDIVNSLPPLNERN